MTKITVRLYDFNMKEVDYEGYKEVSRPNTKAYWEFDQKTLSLKNKKTLDFPVSKGRFVEIYYVGMYFTNGNRLIMGKLDARLSVFQGILPRFTPGSLKVNLFDSEGNQT